MRATLIYGAGDVIGDGAVGLSAVLAAKRGEEGVERVRELTSGDGTHTVLECVGLKPAIETAFAVIRAGGIERDVTFGDALSVATQLLPFIGYARTLNAISCIDDVMPDREDFS